MTPSGASIEVMLDGWRAVNEHPSDATCSLLAKKLLAEMRRHDRADSASGSDRDIADKPLKIQ